MKIAKATNDKKKASTIEGKYPERCFLVSKTVFSELEAAYDAAKKYYDDPSYEDDGPEDRTFYVELPVYKLEKVIRVEKDVKVSYIQKEIR